MTGRYEWVELACGESLAQEREVWRGRNFGGEKKLEMAIHGWKGSIMLTNVG